MQSCLDSFRHLTQQALKWNYHKEINLVRSSFIHFRCKAKLAVRGSIQEPLIGIFSPGSHNVIDMQDCLSHHPEITRSISVIKKCIQAFHLPPYDEISHQGILRYVQIIVNDSGAKQIVLVLNDHFKLENEVVNWISEHLNPVSLYFNFQKDKSNTIFGKVWEHKLGDVFLSHDVKNKKLFLHPGSFCQANLKFFENILNDIESQLEPVKRGIDLYCGAGLFGVVLEEKFEKIDFVETNPFSKLSFDHTCKNIGFSKGTFHQEDSKEFLKKHLDAKCVILDPPRKGLHQEIKPLLGKLALDSQLVYVSCGYKSLIRDVDELIKLGFSIQFLKAYECFPGTDELEILCILKKQNL
jgi:23S rRNA (uracil1939-C5)-methyltransferase